MENSSLTIVGSGIKFFSQLTHEAEAYIKNTEKVLFLVNEPAMQSWITKNNSNSESLDEIYFSSPYRQNAYKAIADYILDHVRRGQHVCVVIYGHPTIFSQPAINAAHQAKKEGFLTRILPGISAEDCIFAELMINPGDCGWQSHEATDFLIRQRKWDNRSHLLLWQVDIIGTLTHVKPDIAECIAKIRLLVNYLSTQYDLDHEVILYEATQYPHIASKVQKIKLAELSVIEISPLATLYIPPIKNESLDEKLLSVLKVSI